MSSWLRTLFFLGAFAVVMLAAVGVVWVQWAKSSFRDVEQREADRKRAEIEAVIASRILETQRAATRQTAPTTSQPATRWE